MAIINIQNCNFHDQSPVIKNLYEAPKEIDFEKIIRELDERKKNLEKGGVEYASVEALEEECKKSNWNAVSKLLGDLSVQFSAATLANLVGPYLCKLFGL